MISILSVNLDQLGCHYRCPVDPCIAVNKVPDVTVIVRFKGEFEYKDEHSVSA